MQSLFTPIDISPSGALTRETVYDPATSLTAHRYWRINWPTGGLSGGTTVAEIQMRTTSGGANVLTGGTASAVSQYDVPYGAANAVDGNSSTLWASATGGTPHWWQYDLGAGNDKIIVEFVITARNDTFAQQAGDSFQLQYSDNGSTWTTVSSESGVTWTAGQTRTFQLRTIYAARTEGAGYLRSTRSIDPSADSLRAPFLPVISSPPSGTLTRELLTGSTYAARTEGAGYWRDQEALFESAVQWRWLVDGATDVQFTALPASVLTWECDGAGQAYFVGSADVAITWLVGGATRVDFGSIGRWQVQGATSVLFGGLWFARGFSQVYFSAAAAAATPDWTVMGAGSMSVRPRVVAGGGDGGGGLVHAVLPGGGDEFPFVGGGGNENIAY